MEFYKTTKCAAVAMLIAATGLFADEVPDARQFAEVSREIWKNTTAINNITESFNKSEEDQETIRQTKLGILKNAAEDFREAEKLYKEKENQANYEALEKKRQDMINVRAELTEMLTDKVVRSINHVDDLQQKFFILSKSYAELNRLAGTYKDNLPNKGADISKQIMGSILSSAQTINTLLEEDPDNQELQTIMDALEGEAKLYEELGDNFTVDLQIQRQAEILKDLTAQLFRVKQSLESRKNEIKAFAIQSLIGDTLTGINIDVPILPPRIIGHSGQIGKELDELREASGQKTSTSKSAGRANGRPFLQKLSERYNNIK